jgi:hypothetical protein
MEVARPRDHMLRNKKCCNIQSKSITVRSQKFCCQKKMARISSPRYVHYLPPNTSHETSYYYSPSRVHQDEKYYSEADNRIVSYEINYHDMHHINQQSNTILHPDTMEPIDPKKLLSESKTEREKQVVSESSGTVELRINGSWSLGITMSSDGLVQKIHEGTPASRARLIFESRVRSIDRFHFSIFA